jgi:hypothetical protein
MRHDKWRDGERSSKPAGLDWSDDYSESIPAGGLLIERRGPSPFRHQAHRKKAVHSVGMFH